MSKSSCLIHSPRSRLVVVRDDYLKLCEDNLPAAILLGLIEHATNYQLERMERVKSENEDREREGLPLKTVDEWIYRKRDEWIKDSMGLLKMHEVKSGMSYLETHGFITRRRHPDFGQLPTRQLKLNHETVNKAMIELFSIAGAAATDDLSNGHRQPQQRSQAAAATVTGSRSIKEGTDTFTDSIAESVGGSAATPCVSCGEPAQLFERNAYWQCRACGAAGDIRHGKLYLNQRKGKAKTTVPKQYHPAIIAVQNLDSRHRIPPPEIHSLLIEKLGDAPDLARLMLCQAEWFSKGYNPRSYVWATEWYGGESGDKKSSSIGCSVCLNDPNKSRLSIPDGFIKSDGSIIRCACNKGVTLEKQRQVEAPAGV